MSNYNICVLGYNNKFNKFLSHLKDVNNKYKCKFIIKRVNKKDTYHKIRKNQRV